MAKSKEASTPLIFALVFFVLTTIAFGVMWYLSYSEMETHVNAKKNAEKDLATLRTAKDEAERMVRVYRVWLGIPNGAPEDDISIVNTEAKPNDKIAAEVKRLNEAFAAKLGTSIEKEQKEASAFLKDELPKMTDEALRAYVKAEKSGDSVGKLINFWGLDKNGKVNPAPVEGLLDQIAKLHARDALSSESANKSLKNYQDLSAKIVTDSKALQTASDELRAVVKNLPVQLQKQIEDRIKQFDARTAQYQQAEAQAGKDVQAAKDAREEADRNLRKANATIAQLQQYNDRLTLEAKKGKNETFSFDEPQGKILRKLADGVVEINIGSAVGVRPGLTFTVLPTDFPEKGRQSRMRMIRTPDGKGGYRSIETFVPKGSIEVFEVVNERLSLARINPGSELDPIRDGVAQGDLLYNSAWRKGVADHIALVGIFDVNGDGIDDIESVVRDLTKMGIPVDAYFDMKKREWVGQVTERTRYVVEGYFPVSTATDPNRDEKTKLLNAMNKAINEGKQKGVNNINFRDFFGRMGYKFRLDVTDEKINQATAPYLSNVGIGAPLTPPAP
ncbi:MAG TPA: hypothetical protein VGE74_28080 [Gemmata sp.]